MLFIVDLMTFQKHEAEQQRASFKKKVNRVSKSGRIIKTPKSILTTSSDEAPRQRSSKKQVDVRAQLQRLREIAKKSFNNKTSGGEHEITAPVAIKESLQDVSTKNKAVSKNIEQSDP